MADLTVKHVVIDDRMDWRDITSVALVVALSPVIIASLIAAAVAGVLWRSPKVIARQIRRRT